MARGAAAKETVAAKLKEAFGENYIAEVDKKHYIWADDGGEKVQIAISLTCPKNFIETGETVVAGEGFPAASPVTTAKHETAEISDKERENIAALMARLGL